MTVKMRDEFTDLHKAMKEAYTLNMHTPADAVYAYVLLPVAYLEQLEIEVELWRKMAQNAADSTEVYQPSSFRAWLQDVGAKVDEEFAKRHK